jgi:quercetin dioxygenase-like cupin family protein
MLLRSIEGVRPQHMTDPGWSKVVSRLLAGPRDGCNKMTIRLLTIGPGGHTPRDSSGADKLFLVQYGAGEYVDSDGFAHEIGPGDVVFVPSWELQHFQNRTESDLGLLQISGQGQ